MKLKSKPCAWSRLSTWHYTAPCRTTRSRGAGLKMWAGNAGGFGRLWSAMKRFGFRRGMETLPLAGNL